MLKLWVNPFGKIPFFALFQKYLLIALKVLFSFENILGYFDKKKRNLGLPPWKNSNFESVSMIHFYCLNSFLFYLEYYQRIFPDYLNRS